MRITTKRKTETKEVLETTHQMEIENIETQTKTMGVNLECYQRLIEQADQDENVTTLAAFHYTSPLNSLESSQNNRQHVRKVHSSAILSPQYTLAKNKGCFDSRNSHGYWSMPRQWLLLVLLLLASCLVAKPANALANCPNGCQCNDDTLVVKCGEGTLDVLPIALNPSIQRLVIKNNKIKTIDSSIQFYTELRFLDLSFNDLVTIPPRTFALQRKLQELHLNYNKIGQINNKTLLGLSAVTIMNLRGNLMSELEDYTFSPLLQVEELNLGQNRISRISTHAFDGLKNLKVLYLDDNTLTAVPAPENFQAMPLLAELYLGTNSFMSIPNKAFEDLKGLTRLDLKGAGLRNLSLEAMKGLEGVRYLDLSDNSLEFIPQTALSHLERLEDLSLGQNAFEVISANALQGLKNLKRLLITGAQRLRKVENAAFSGNTNLEYLNLSANKMLAEIEENAFSGLPHLKHIILKENKIDTLSEGLFDWSDLITLDISENPLMCDCRLLWLRTLAINKNNTSEQIQGVICAAPSNLKGESLNKLSPAILGCNHSDAKQQALIGVLLVVTAATITALALIIYSCRRRIREALKGGWGNSALGRKEQEYQKTFSEEDYMNRHPQIPCAMSSSAPYATSTSGYGGQHALQYMGTRPIPVTEL
uniref:LRRCT domain-containing protein n=1 Tax=Stomoxys calcitrans TaxID=35570 RepID=A0A1I8PTR4_STOCA